MARIYGLPKGASHIISLLISTLCKDAAAAKTTAAVALMKAAAAAEKAAAEAKAAAGFPSEWSLEPPTQSYGYNSSGREYF